METLVLPWLRINQAAGTRSVWAFHGWIPIGPKVKEALDLTEEQGVKMREIQSDARERVMQAKLLVEPDTATGIAKELKSHLASLTSIASTRRIDLIYYDIGSSGESATNPKTRFPPFRSQHFQKCVTGVLKSYLDDPSQGPTEIPDDVVFVIAEGQRMQATQCVRESLRRACFQNCQFIKAQPHSARH